MLQLFYCFKNGLLSGRVLMGKQLLRINPTGKWMSILQILGFRQETLNAAKYLSVSITSWCMKPFGLWWKGAVFEEHSWSAVVWGWLLTVQMWEGRGQCRNQTQQPQELKWHSSCSPFPSKTSSSSTRLSAHPANDWREPRSSDSHYTYSVGFLLLIIIYYFVQLVCVVLVLFGCCCSFLQPSWKFLLSQLLGFYTPCLTSSRLSWNNLVSASAVLSSTQKLASVSSMVQCRAL